ncbi:MAG: MFS transporter [Firmicutes bacterium]|nr:MFS transporter [Alicyclobacillaceae bacterium]MCL6496849.1 MFS transporter [Bacillota bacterium]
MANYLPGVLPVLAAVRHVPVAWAGSFMTALLLGQGLQPLAGWWADRVGGRRFVLAGVTLSTFSAALVGWVRPLPVIWGLLLLTGIGNTLFHPQAMTAARTLAGRREGTSMSAFLVGGEVGRGIGPLAATVVAVHWGLSRLWLLALPLAVTWLPLWRVTPSAPRRRPAVGGIHWRQHLGPAAALVGFAALRSGATYTVVTLAPLIWHHRGGTLVAGAGLVTTLIGIGIVGNLGGGVVSDRLGRGAVLLGSTVLTAVMLALFTAADHFWIWPTLALLGIALFASSPVTLLMGQDIFAENPAFGSGVALGLANGIGALMVFPLTYVAARMGYDTAIWVLVAMTVASWPLVAWLVRHRGGVRPKPA